MYAGEIVEQAPVDELFEDPRHPYTQGLLRALPKVSTTRRRLDPIPGLGAVSPDDAARVCLRPALSPCSGSLLDRTAGVGRRPGRSGLPVLQPAAVRRLMPAAPVPVAIRLPDGLVLRGHEWPVDGPAVVFLHDHGDDLDAWGSYHCGSGFPRVPGDQCRVERPRPLGRRCRSRPGGARPPGPAGGDGRLVRPRGAGRLRSGHRSHAVRQRGSRSARPGDDQPAAGGASRDRLAHYPIRHAPGGQGRPQRGSRAAGRLHLPEDDGAPSFR